MNRIDMSKQKYKELFGEEESVLSETDSEFYGIMNKFIYGDVFNQGELDDKIRGLITIAVITVNQTIEQLSRHIEAGIRVGLSSVEIKEAIYQCAPYIGFPKVINALEEANKVFESKGISLPVSDQGQVDEQTRFEKGFAVQVDVFGEIIKQNRENAPENQKHIQDYLSEFCFGDFYTRKGLDINTRELITLCIISALGGCENQLKGHIKGNVNVGNSKDKLITAITQCLPYIGFPRTLNALAAINEIIQEV